MSETLINPSELRARGFEVLVQSLGWVNAVRFVNQFEVERHNYTAERDQILPDWNADQLVAALTRRNAGDTDDASNAQPTPPRS
jgi:hypothetical protein